MVTTENKTEENLNTKNLFFSYSKRFNSDNEEIVLNLVLTKELKLLIKSICCETEPLKECRILNGSRLSDNAYINFNRYLIKNGFSYLLNNRNDFFIFNTELLNNDSLNITFYNRVVLETFLKDFDRTLKALISNILDSIIETQINYNVVKHE